MLGYAICLSTAHKPQCGVHVRCIVNTSITSRPHTIYSSTSFRPHSGVHLRVYILFTHLPPSGPMVEYISGSTYYLHIYLLQAPWWSTSQGLHTIYTSTSLRPYGGVHLRIYTLFSHVPPSGPKVEYISGSIYCLHIYLPQVP